MAHRLADAVARGVALFLAGFTLLNLIGAWRTPGFDANVWWIDLGFLPGVLEGLLLGVSALLLLAWVVSPAAGLWRRRATLAALALLAVAALSNAVSFYRVWSRGEIDPGVPVPFSLVVLAVLVWLAWVAARGAAGPPPESPPHSPAPRAWLRFLISAAAFVACGIVFPLAQFWFFGHTDYRRPADVAVVFGAQVHPGGRPSTSLVDRVTTGVDLYVAGLVPRIIMSGAVGESGDNEALVMTQYAVDSPGGPGVPVDAIIIDPEGSNSQATVDNTVKIFKLYGYERILVVSHFYHLPRLKLAYARAGYDVLTVPARSTGPVSQTPYIVAREVPAFWVYYLRAVLR
jgi:vancomycin permeability regulator SanA